jgi:hypothetical protein
MSLVGEVSDPVITDSGSRMTIALNLSGGPPVAGIQGRFNFDPQQIRFAGLEAELKNTTFTAVNDLEADRGELLFISTDPTTFDRRFVFMAFDVIGPPPLSGTAFDVQRVISRGSAPFTPPSTAPVSSPVT